jgi:CubicO group peptidase (beta-lactamase class C family)
MKTLSRAPHPSPGDSPQRQPEAGLKINGGVEKGFERVRDAFAANFTRGGDYEDVGAALAVYRAGKPVVDLWAGHKDRARTRAWQRGTLVNVYSTTKGIVATAVALLVEQGKLRYDDPVVKHWPEYGQHGKEKTTVAHLLSHQAGLPGFAEPTTVQNLYDWKRCCAALARQKPMWTPGNRTSYHAMTWGFLVGEVVRRASGQTVGQLIAGNIAAPLAADVYVGLEDSLEPLVAQMLGPRRPPEPRAAPLPPEALAALVNPQLEGEVCNARAWRAAEIPAANGQASAAGVARVYAALANKGVLDGQRLLKGETIMTMTQRHSGRTDALLGFVDNWAMGLGFNQMNLLGPSPQTFGHGGWGGSFGCANLEAQVGIGYVCNQMGAQLVGDPRGTGLCHAIWECL